MAERTIYRPTLIASPGTINVSSDIEEDESDLEKQLRNFVAILPPSHPFVQSKPEPSAEGWFYGWFYETC